MDATAFPIRIDDGVPMPRSKTCNGGGGAGGKRGGPIHDTLFALQIGQSFVFPSVQGRPIERHQQIASSRVAHFSRRGLNGRFATRIVEEDGERVVRVWRTA